MPIYTYRCSSCGSEFDELHRIDDRNKPCENPCKECGEHDTLSIKLQPVAMGDSVRLGIRSTDDGFKEVLSKVSKTAGSNLSSKLSRN